MGASAPVKYHYSQRYFTYSMSWKRGSAPLSSFKAVRGRSKWKTLSGGEFGWGGTSVKRLHCLVLNVVESLLAATLKRTM